VKTQLTEAEQVSEPRMTAAGISIVTTTTSTVTLLARKTTEELVAEASRLSIPTALTPAVAARFQRCAR
jgi:hypothetical protein